MNSDAEKTQKPIQFFVPENALCSAIPTDANDVWTWICNTPGIQTGRMIWTVYTYLMLRQACFNCVLTRKLPDGGIVVAHRDFLPAIMRPRGSLFLVCLKADRKQHSWANMHVAQNPHDPICRDPSRYPSECMPHWPQPSMVPRDPERGTSVRHVAYFGLAGNLDPSLRQDDWTQTLRAMGLTWRSVPMSQWHDYFCTDVTVSVRRFGGQHIVSSPIHSSESKPPSKLVNSWLAGVPAIVGDESAYLSLQKSSLDFLVVRSREELLAAIQRLANDPTLYADMVANGRERGKQFDAEAVRAHWIRLFEERLAKQHQQWSEKPLWRRSVGVWARYLSYWADPANIQTAWRGLFGLGEQ